MKSAVMTDNSPNSHNLLISWTVGYNKWRTEGKGEMCVCGGGGGVLIGVDQSDQSEG